MDNDHIFKETKEIRVIETLEFEFNYLILTNLFSMLGIFSCKDGKFILALVYFFIALSLSFSINKRETSYI